MWLFNLLVCVLPPVKQIKQFTFALHQAVKQIKKTFINKRIHICDMEWTEEFEPTSEVSGNIEITFNSKNKEFDKYESIKKQLILTIGKTGRANRLTFENPESEELLKAARVLKEIGQDLMDLEKEVQDIENEEFDADNIEPGVLSEQESMIMDKIPEGNSGIKEDQLFSSLDMEASDFKDALRGLKREGEIYEPEENKLASI